MAVEPSQVQAGHDFKTVIIRLDTAWVEQYLDAVGGDFSPYRQRGWVPPMALVARSLKLLMDQLALPSGALHVGQELESVMPARLGEEVAFKARVAQTAIRGGWQILALDLEAQDLQGRELLRGRATLSIPQGGASGGR